LKLGDQRPIGEILDDALLGALKNNPQIIEALPERTIAELAIKRAPKPMAQDEGLQQSYLSLRKCLSGLPDLEDVNLELMEAKQQCMMLEAELDVQRSALAMANNALNQEGDHVWQALKQYLDALKDMLRKFKAGAEVRSLPLDFGDVRARILRLAAERGKQNRILKGMNDANRDDGDVRDVQALCGDEGDVGGGGGVSGEGPVPGSGTDAELSPPSSVGDGEEGHVGVRGTEVEAGSADGEGTGGTGAEDD
jgi:hypothetical protein